MNISNYLICIMTLLIYDNYDEIRSIFGELNAKNK